MTTLEKIRKKVRRLTATPSTLQLSDTEIDEYIDTFYTQDLPAHLKLWNLHETYTFYTTQHEDQYTLPLNTYLAINPPIYIAGYQSYYSQLPEQFFNLYPKLNYEEVMGQGDGTAAFSGTLTNTPVLKRHFMISAVDGGDVTRTLVDVPIDDITGNLVAEGTTAPNVGTINYVSGAVVVTNFGANIPTTNDITAQYVPYEPNRPTAVLFYDDTFTLRPVPDQAYRVEVEVYRTPTQLLQVSGDSPDVEQWWQYIAFGAAYKILEDRQDTETMVALAERLDEQKQLVLHRTIVQQTPQQTATIFSDQLGNFYSNGNQGRY